MAMAVLHFFFLQKESTVFDPEQGNMNFFNSQCSFWSELAGEYLLAEDRN